MAEAAELQASIRAYLAERGLADNFAAFRRCLVAAARFGDQWAAFDAARDAGRSGSSGLKATTSAMHDEVSARREQLRFESSGDKEDARLAAEKVASAHDAWSKSLSGLSASDKATAQDQRAESLERLADMVPAAETPVP